jgi:predicted acyl esterase
VLGPSPEFDRDGYIFAFQDARGKFRSEGTFRVMNPYKPVKNEREGRRREQRQLRHHRLAAQEHPA